MKTDYKLNGEVYSLIFNRKAGEVSVMPLSDTCAPVSVTMKKFNELAVILCGVLCAPEDVDTIARKIVGFTMLEKMDRGVA